MPCPLCNHTMQNLGLATSGSRTFWCPRCGTLKTESGDFSELEIPRWTKMLSKFEHDAAWRELEASHHSVVADDVCPKCGGSGGGDEPHVTCRNCDGTGRRKT